ncbi:tail fiber protein [Pedobacter africanus]|uniref:Chaperone of endosialidase n=1 Tax=Pedobacter africanus TaxID=151894 RepID=A0A1W2BQG6_9SPHI|nr:tail fiber protein [Pedobacter africanus]SMC74954.1 hypothetical protein SAMN04488524_2541 [Pedobacter africanus]
MKKFILFSSLVCACFSADAQTLQAVTDNGASTSNTLNSSNPNGFQVTGTSGNPAYMVIDQTANSGGKRWRFGHTGAASGFSSFDILNITDGIAPLSLAPNGNVGVGTTNPQNKLHIHQNVPDQAGLIVQGNTINTDFAKHYVAITLDGDYGNGTGNYSQIRSYSNLYSSWGSQLAFFTTTLGVVNTLEERMRIDDKGNVGIGVQDPASRKLKVLTSNPVNDVGAEIEIARSSGTNYGIIGKAIGSGADYNVGMFTSANGGTSNFGLRIYNVPSGANNYTVYSDSPAQAYFEGNMGIGTTNPDGYKLAVKGKVRAHEIKVETGNWPDYVFAKDYQLPTLQETEKHIKDKGHLPGIPSAAEVKANGVDLGEMNAKLLQKIEELTLHLIEQNKKFEAKISAQQQEIDLLKQKNK